MGPLRLPLLRWQWQRSTPSRVYYRAGLLRNSDDATANNARSASTVCCTARFGQFGQIVKFFGFGAAPQSPLLLKQDNTPEEASEGKPIIKLPLRADSFPASVVEARIMPETAADVLDPRPQSA